MKIVLSLFFVVVIFLGGEALAEDPTPLAKVRCTVTRVDKTPVYFLGPHGQFPGEDSQIDLDLGTTQITEDLEFDPFGNIPLKSIKQSLVKKDQFSHENPGVTYFEGQFTSQSKAVYTMAIHVDLQGVGALQIARQGFMPKLELYNADLNCVARE